MRSPIAFSFDNDNGFVWHGAFEMTYNYGFEEEPPKNSAESLFEKAVRLIREMLSGGAIEAVQIIKTAEERGISEKTLKRAKSELGVISVKRGGQWFWEMPYETRFTDFAQGGQEGQGGQGKNLTPLSLLKSGNEVV
jgi:hypothetical protein